MIIVRMKSLNTDREQRKRIREELQEQTRQEVVVLPCECQLERVSEELELGTIEAVGIDETRNKRMLKIIELLSKVNVCPYQFGMKGDCRKNKRNCKKCWEEALEDESGREKISEKDFENILEELEKTWNDWR